MDDSFGPRLFGHFDFTLLFEHTMFYIIPSSIMIFATPFYIHKIFRGTPIVRSGRLLLFKLSFAAALIGLQVANAVLWSESPLDSRLARATAILSSISAVCISILIYAGHVFYLQPLPFLGFFLTVTMLFDIVTTMTYFNRTNLDTIARLHIPMPIIKLALICLEEFSKRSLIRSEALRSTLGQESMAGFWNRSLLVWVNSFLLFGFRQEITQKSLPELGPQFESESLYRDFQPHWDRANKVSKYALLKVCVYTMPWPFLYIVLPRVLAIGFEFAQPFLLQDVVKAVSETETSKDVTRGLILATGAVYLGKAVSKSWYTHLRNQITISMRGILIAAIYHKSLRLSADDLDASAAVTLMTADVTGMAELVSFSYDSWARVLEVCAGIAILGAVVGAATVFTIIPVFGTTVLSVFVARKMMHTRKEWNGHIQSRVAATSNILAQIKDIKMLGLTPMLADRLQKQFETEVGLSMLNRKYQSETLGLSAIAEALTPVLVVAATLFWTRASEPVTAARLFTLLALVTLVTNPAYWLIHTFGNWSTGLACLSRVQEYLNISEPADPRQFAVQNGPEDGGNPLPGTGPPALSNQQNLHGASTGVVVFAVQMIHVSVSTDLSGSILVDITMNVAMGGITMVYGSVGCGKSTLLKTILGEVKLRCGVVTLASRSVAYCSQIPWIENDTIQNNIIFGRPFNAVLYRKVVYICALDADLARLPQRDETMAGSEGCNLSGGQKQRISMARALYSEAELIIFDDTLSGLDRETSSTVRLRLFSDSDILESGMTTIIMTTSIKEHLEDADVAYEIDEDGKIDFHAERERQRQIERELAQQRGENNFVESASQTSTRRVNPVAVIKSKESEGELYEPPEAKPAPDNTLHDNLSSSKYGDRSLYTYFLKPAGLSGVLIWLSIYAVTALFDRLPPIFVRIWLDRDAENRLYFIGFAVLGVIVPCLYYIAPRSFYRYIVVKSAPSLHRALLDTTSSATFEYLTGQDAGALLNRFSLDISMATQRLPGTITPTVWGFFSIIIDVAVISAGANYALPIIPLFLFVLFLIQHFYLRTSRPLRILELDSNEGLVRHFTESGRGIEHIRAFRSQEEFIMRFNRILDATQKPYFYINYIQQWLALSMNLTTASAAICVVSLALNFKESTSGSATGLALLSLISFSDFTGSTIQIFVNMENTFGAVARIRDYARRTPREEDSNSCQEVPDQWPFSGRVDLSCVSAVYKPESAKPHVALENITLSVQPGQTVGLTGRTGSGKTSVLLALLHLLEYTGSIYIDGLELRNIPRNLLRTRITTITQAGIMLKASVRFNIDPFEFTSRAGDFPADEMLAGILRRVGLWEHIVRHGGLDALVGAMKFSVGQRQLFQLARAILHRQITRSSLVLVDEGTASMDEETEQRVYGLMMEVFAGCTKIIISHRQAALAYADVVLNLTDGRGEVYRPQAGGTANYPVNSIEGDY